jgi:hypothetical protein
MQDSANPPAAVPVLSPEATGRTAKRRDLWLVGIGVGVGLALGILLTSAVYQTYTLLTHTLPSTKDSVLVFNELNELRQQLNELNEQRKLQEKEKEAAVRQALSAVASTARAPDSGAPGVVPTAKKLAGGADRPPVAKSHDPMADVDAEIERLEQTQKVLNTILDMFSTKDKERPKDH